jgi:hypothetical protein
MDILNKLVTMASNNDIISIGAIAISFLTGGDIFTGFLPERFFKRTSFFVAFVDRVACKVSNVCKWIQEFGNHPEPTIADIEKKLKETIRIYKELKYKEDMSSESRNVGS